MVNCLDDLYQKRFLPTMMTDHINANASYWYMQRLYYNVSYGNLGCCSDVAVSFHYISPQKMYLLEYFIYHVHPFGIEKNLTEILPRKLSLEEIIAASDIPSESPLYMEHEHKHNIEPDERY